MNVTGLTTVSSLFCTAHTALQGQTNLTSVYRAVKDTVDLSQVALTTETKQTLNNFFVFWISFCASYV